jgi:hypothetical protein
MRCPSPNQWACAVQRQLWELESHAPVLGIPWLSVDLLAVEAAVGAGAEEWMTGGGRGGSCRAGGGRSWAPGPCRPPKPGGLLENWGEVWGTCQSPRSGLGLPRPAKFGWERPFPSASGLVQPGLWGLTGNSLCRLLAVIGNMNIH